MRFVAVRNNEKTYSCLYTAHGYFHPDLLSCILLVSYNPLYYSLYRLKPFES